MLEPKNKELLKVIEVSIENLENKYSDTDTT